MKSELFHHNGDFVTRVINSIVVYVLSLTINRERIKIYISRCTKKRINVYPKALYTLLCTQLDPSFNQKLKASKLIDVGALHVDVSLPVATSRARELNAEERA